MDQNTKRPISDDRTETGRRHDDIEPIDTDRIDGSNARHDERVIIPDSNAAA